MSGKAILLCTVGGLVSLVWAIRADAQITVNCGASQTISGALAALAPSNTTVVINVSGTCHENLTIPHNQAVHLVATPSATIEPADSSGYATIVARGKLVIDAFNVVSTDFAAIAVDQGGVALLNAGTITGAGNGVWVANNGTVEITDVSITVTGQAAVSTSNGATVDILGMPNVFGADLTSLTGGSYGVLCHQGNLNLFTNAGGSIHIRNNPIDGISALGCNVEANGLATGVIHISNNGVLGQFSAALELHGDYAILNTVTIANNLDFGISATAGAAVEINGSTITGNSGTAISASQNAVVDIESFHGVNTMTAGSSGSLFGCYQGGKIYTNQISGTITPPPTNLGCLTVGGP
jgi:hypothetical protein